ncbi:MAG TPA: DMT family transporter [Candidatus Latescibacteria bacterium]|nr:DMT family transporter [Candidatus Latescibacterota bacterium]
MLLYAVAFGIGIVLAVHLTMNSVVGTMMGSARAANAIFWTVGAAAAVLIWLLGPQRGLMSNAKCVPSWLWVAGAIGASLVFGIAALIPKLGARSVFVLTVAGQVLASAWIAHVGFLGSPQKELTSVNLVGIAIMLSGVYLATK